MGPVKYFSAGLEKVAGSEHMAGLEKVALKLAFRGTGKLCHK